ncbi:MAG TPA: SHOCT domain-containing protein [Candidatus Dormibacteraeota bacterium]|nr:SHOCT domain-containing protein [Candidatus Dormibacteraeota bacterium]
MIPFGIIGGLAWVLIVVGAVLLVIWAVRAFAAQPSIRSAGAPLQSVSVESPLYILERRFALGEIGADEFEKARALLRDEGATT